MGGFGGYAIRGLRKKVACYIPKKTPDDSKATYLYIDSSEELMGHDHPEWKISGNQSVQLQPDDQVYLCPKNLKHILENPKQWPGIHPWIGDVDYWQRILGAQPGQSGFTAQTRRLGRLLFAANVDRFSEALSRKVREIDKNSRGKATIHVCSSLGGGTGGGIIVDVLNQIRSIIPEKIIKDILLYLFVPGESALPKQTDSHVVANNYAALLELNSYDVGQFQPHNLTGQGERSAGSCWKSAFAAYTAAYLFSDRLENGYVISAEHIKPANILADFLFHKIFSLEDAQIDGTSNLVRAETWQFQDRSVTPETGLARETPTCDGFELQEPKRERSCRFLTFGVMAITPDMVSQFSSLKAYEEACKEEYPSMQTAEGTAEDVQDMACNALPEIMEKIGSDNSKKVSFLSQFLADSAVLLSRDHKQIAMAGPFSGMIPGHAIWVEFLFAIAPKTKPPVQDEIIHLLEKLDPRCSVLPGGPCRRGITLIKIAARFPLRTVSLLKNLRQEYEKLICSGRESARYVHSEDKKDMSLPNLDLLPTWREIETLAIPHLLIGLAMGVVQKRRRETKLQKPRLAASDRFVVTDSIAHDMSEDVVSTAGEISPEEFIALRFEVREVLAREQIKREALLQKLEETFTQEQDLVERRYGTASEETTRLQNGFGRAMQILSKYDPPPKPPTGLAAI